MPIHAQYLKPGDPLVVIQAKGLQDLFILGTCQIYNFESKLLCCMYKTTTPFIDAPEVVLIATVDLVKASMDRDPKMSINILGSLDSYSEYEAHFINTDAKSKVSMDLVDIHVSQNKKVKEVLDLIDIKQVKNKIKAVSNFFEMPHKTGEITYSDLRNYIHTKFFDYVENGYKKPSNFFDVPF